MRKKMTSKERVLTAFAHQEPDRVPVNYVANLEIDLGLKEHFGLARDDREGLLRALGVDLRSVRAPYVGPKLHKDPPGVVVDEWGIHRRWVEHGTGGYWDYCDWPLRDATLAQVAAWPMPRQMTMTIRTSPACAGRIKRFASQRAVPAWAT